jgi:hypothetical protein
MDKKLLSMAEQAIAKVKPLKGYKLGVWDAGIRKETQELVVILLDGRKMIFPLVKGAPDMKAKPDPLAQMDTPKPTPINHQSAPAPTAKSSGGRSKPKESK